MNARTAFCCLLSVIAVAFVVKGEGLQGFVLWFLYGLLGGTLMEGHNTRTWQLRLADSTVISVTFIVTALAVLVIFGAGLSGFHSKGDFTTLDIENIQFRLGALWENLSAIAIFYFVVFLATCLLLYVAGTASIFTLSLLTNGLAIPVGQLRAMSIKMKISMGMLTMIGTLVAKFA